MNTEILTETETHTEHETNNYAGFGAHFLTSTETETSGQNQTNTKKKSRNHIEFDEKGQKVYNCSHCDKSYNSHHRWKLHEKLHTDPNLFSCKRCDFVARTWQIMKKHELAEHDSREKQYSCRFCPKTFMKFNSVKPHERTHTGERPYPCSYCDKRFTQLHRCKEHERIHTGEKPFSCKHCDYKSRAASTLRTHELLKHSDEVKERSEKDAKSYVCSFNGCKEKFNDANQVEFVKE